MASVLPRMFPIDRPRLAVPARACAAGLALLAALGPLLGLAHAEAVRHATCAEHGELIEAASASAEIGHDHDGLPEDAASAQTDRGVAGKGHQHDHCALAQHSRDRAAQPQPTAPSAPACGAQGCTGLDETELRLARAALYRLAPKGSPPAQA